MSNTYFFKIRFSSFTSLSPYVIMKITKTRKRARRCYHGNQRWNGYCDLCDDEFANQDNAGCFYTGIEKNTGYAGSPGKSIGSDDGTFGNTRLQKAGYLVVYNPYAELYHYESKSRGLEDTPEKVARFNQEIATFEKRWPDILKNGDPFYNPNLTLDSQDFSLKRL